MNSRIQHALDGELSVPELNSVEVAELKAVANTLSRVVDTLPEGGIDTWPAVRRRLYAEIRSHRKPGLPAWLWETRRLSIRWRPGYGLMAALLLVAVLAGLRILGSRTTVPSTPIAQQVLGRRGSTRRWRRRPGRTSRPRCSRVRSRKDGPREWSPTRSRPRSKSG